jgi:sarcosine oxidase gamma subunit
MSFEFLMTDAAVAGDTFKPIARTPMESKASAAGARFEVRDGWNLAVGYGVPERESKAIANTAGWADVSHLGKIELQAQQDDLRAIVAACAGGAELSLGEATRADSSWWCPLTHQRAIVICEPSRLPALREVLADAAAQAPNPTSVIDVSTVFAAMTVLGPLSREVFARFSALDLRPMVTPVAGLRPGSIARQPGILIREDDDRFLFLFGWGTGEYIWTVVSDAGVSLGGAPVGVDMLPPVAEHQLPSAKAKRTQPRRTAAKRHGASRAQSATQQHADPPATDQHADRPATDQHADQPAAAEEVAADA